MTDKEFGFRAGFLKAVSLAPFDVGSARLQIELKEFLKLNPETDNFHLTAKQFFEHGYVYGNLSDKREEGHRERSWEEFKLWYSQNVSKLPLEGVASQIDKGNEENIYASGFIAGVRSNGRIPIFKGHEKSWEEFQTVQKREKLLGKEMPEIDKGNYDFKVAENRCNCPAKLSARWKSVKGPHHHPGCPAHRLSPDSEEKIPFHVRYTEEGITEQKPEEKCENCKFYQDQVCRRFPPKRKLNSIYNGFPSTTKDTWCGEWQNGG